MPTTLIYILVDPRDNSTRYVGKTVGTLAERLQSHISNRRKTKVSVWVQQIVAAGLRPIIREVERVDEGWAAREVYWIEQLRSQGAPLTNIAKGGHGPVGFRHTEEAKAKISVAGRGRSHTEAAKEKMRSRPTSPETAARISAALVGKPILPDRRAKIAASLTGRKHSPETLAKLKARRHSPETIAKMTGRIVAPETCAKLAAATQRAWDEGRMPHHSRPPSQAACQETGATRATWKPGEPRGPMSDEHKRKIAEANKLRVAAMERSRPEEYQAYLDRLARARAKSPGGARARR